MTSLSRKSRPTTRPNTTATSPPDGALGAAAAGRAAAAYREVSLSTGKDAVDPVGASEPLWLPAGWLAVVLMLSAATPSLGAGTGDGWRARGSSSRVSQQTHRSHKPGPRFQAVSRVSYEDDISGPALRVASRPAEYGARGGARANGFVDRGYRVAQGNELEDALERPFGVDPNEADAADRMFDDLPADPFDESQDNTMDDADDQRSAGFGDNSFEEPAPRPRSLFDEEPDFDNEPEEIAPADSLADDIAAPLGSRVERQRQKERDDAAEDCAEGLAELKAQRLDSIDLYIGVTGTEGEDYPFACSIDDGSVHAPRCWNEVTYMWKASALCHKPLYFEDVHLERYGHSWGPYLDPLVSGAHFFGRIPVLPYCMGLKTPNECVYTLGHYRPGNCAPYFLDPFPFTWRAAIFQAGATVGAAAILP